MMLACALTMVIILGLIGYIGRPYSGIGRYRVRDFNRYRKVSYMDGHSFLSGNRTCCWVVNGILIAHQNSGIYRNAGNPDIGRGLCQVICNGAPVRCSEETFLPD